MGFLAEQNLKMLGSTLAASFVLTISIFFIMQWLIDVGDVELDNTSIKIDITNDKTNNIAFKRGLVRELLDSFVRRLEEPNQ